MSGDSVILDPSTLFLYRKNELLKSLFDGLDLSRNSAEYMMAYANLNAVEKTQETGFAHYWSRSRDTLWKKGENSGNFQKIVEVLVDCDRDTLIYKVFQI